jgi:putative oxidoreductase
MKNFEPALAVAGRILLAALFLPSGIGKLLGLQGTAAYIASKGLPAATVLALGAAALEILGSVALLAGWKVRWVALALALFTLLAGFLFHDFWTAPPNLELFQRLAFFKNLGIAGGLLLFAALGPGPLSIDKEKA